MRSWSPSVAGAKPAAPRPSLSHTVAPIFRPTVARLQSAAISWPTFCNRATRPGVRVALPTAATPACGYETIVGFKLGTDKINLSQCHQRPASCDVDGGHLQPALRRGDSRHVQCRDRPR